MPFQLYRMSKMFNCSVLLVHTMFMPSMPVSGTVLISAYVWHAICSAYVTKRAGRVSY